VRYVRGKVYGEAEAAAWKTYLEAEEP